MQFKLALPVGGCAPLGARRLATMAFAAAVVTGIGCSGTVGQGDRRSDDGDDEGVADEVVDDLSDDSSDGTSDGDDETPGPVTQGCNGAARTGRLNWQLGPLTARQVATVVGQAFGPTALADEQVKAMIANIPANLRNKHFDTESKTVSAQFADGYIGLGRRLATLAAEQAPVRAALEQFAGKSCQGTTDLESTCGTELARELATALGRSPVDPADFDYLINTYKTNKSKYQATKAYAGFIASVLLGAKSALRFDAAELAKTGTVDAHTLGARLALTLTSGLPDATLRAKIKDGSILEREVRLAEAKRLLRTEAGRATLRSFAEQWLNVLLLKSPPAGNGFVATLDESAAVGKAAYEEVGALFENAVLEGRTLADFYATEEVVPAHDWLARIYETQKGTGLARPGASDRKGILTRAAFHLHGAVPDWLPLAHRGYNVRVTMLCGTVGAFPDMVDTSLPDNAPDVMSSTEYFRTLTERGVCEGCHSAMNPYGYAMSGFSVTGARAAMETVRNRKTKELVQVPADETSEIELDGGTTRVTNATELSNVVGGSAEARACFMHRFDQYTVGLEAEFQCAASAKDRTLEETIVAYVGGNAFALR